MNTKLRVEFHCHSLYSKDCLTSPEHLLAACRKKRIDRVILTDHNTIAGALYARQIDPQRVIIGEEIMTQQGEILAAFVKEEIPAGLPALQVIERLRQQGAFISVSHPFDRLRSGHWALPDLLAIAPYVDAIEIFNSRCLWWPAFNWQAQAFARQHHLPGTVGSDAHSAYELGRATLSLDFFEDSTSLKQALVSGQAEARLSFPWVFLASRSAKWRKKQLQKRNALKKEYGR